MNAGPVVYEISTWVWLDELSRRDGSTISLDNVPEAEWDDIAALGVDAVWLMGVWERSPLGTELMRTQLAEWADIVGSPYCIRGYVPDPHLGGWPGLDRARGQLQARGMGLLLDFVPNHVAPDHPWTLEHPEYFVPGNEVAGAYAYGRELPGSPPWSDVAQLNAFHPGARAAAAATLLAIAEHCDGVRCDMAMLALNDEFARTWGDRAGPVPAEEYWAGVIGEVRRAHPGFLFLAEAYWDCEWRLLQLGFDFCYDKVLCDRLIHGDGPLIRAHLEADRSFQQHLVRFLENHDEERSAAVLSPERLRAAALAIATLPGATLLYEGQLVGREKRLPVAVGRRPAEPADGRLHAFYADLLHHAHPLRAGSWQLAPVTGWPDNDSRQAVVAWTWDTGEAIFLVAINFSAGPAQGEIHFPLPAELHGARPFSDLLTGETYQRDVDDIRQRGLYVDLPGFGFHFLRLTIS